MKKKRAMYPGSFDPITNGHVDIVQRALQVFDEITIVIAGNLRKKNSLFSFEERKGLAEQVFAGNNRVNVEVCHGLISDYARQHGGDAILRGLRATSDFENEFLMANMNRELNGEIETYFLVTDKNLFFVSSSGIKEIAWHGGNISKYVPPLVEKALRNKYKEEADV